MSKQVLFANNAIKKHLKRLTPAQEYAWMNPNPPDQPHANLLQRLIPIAQIKYARLMLKKRETVWGHTPLVFRVRLYKASKEERVSLVIPNIQSISLYSQTLKRMIKLDMTVEMCRHIEGMGGLDEYLLKTPDSMLKSDVSSALRFKIMSIHQKAEHDLWVSQKEGVDQDRRQMAETMMRKAMV
ncbi:MAG: hypothetical protein WDW38_005307 [Sanguina aurantia]